MPIDTQHRHYEALCDVARGLQYTLEDVTGQGWNVMVQSLQHFDVQFGFACGNLRCQSPCLDTETPIDRPRLLRDVLNHYWRYQDDPKLQAVLAEIRSITEAH